MSSPAELEYLIKRTDGDWFDYPPEAWPAAFQPPRLVSEVVEATGGRCVIRFEGFTATFVDEMPGIYVVAAPVHTAPADVDRGMAAVLEQIEAVTGQQGEVVPL